MRLATQSPNSAVPNLETGAFADCGQKRTGTTCLPRKREKLDVFETPKQSPRNTDPPKQSPVREHWCGVLRLAMTVIFFAYFAYLAVKIFTAKVAKKNVMLLPGEGIVRHDSPVLTHWAL